MEKILGFSGNNADISALKEREIAVTYTPEEKSEPKKAEVKPTSTTKKKK